MILFDKSSPTLDGKAPFAVKNIQDRVKRMTIRLNFHVERTNFGAR